MALQALHLWQSRRYNSSRVWGSLLCESHRQCFSACGCAGLSVYRVCTSGVRVVTKRLIKAVHFFFRQQPLMLAATKSVKQQQQQQYNQRQPCFKLLCLCVVVAQLEIEPRQHFHVQRNDQIHIVRPHNRHTKHTAAARAVAYTQIV